MGHYCINDDVSTGREKNCPTGAKELLTDRSNRWLLLGSFGKQ